MKIKLKYEWMGHPEGSIVDLTKIAAERLIRLERAEEVVEVKQEDKKETKAVSAPPKDKMVRRPKRKK